MQKKHCSDPWKNDCHQPFYSSQRFEIKKFSIQWFHLFDFVLVNIFEIKNKLNKFLMISDYMIKGLSVCVHVPLEPAVLNQSACNSLGPWD